MEKINIELLASRSKTPIEKTIKSLGIEFPNSSIGFLHAKYAKFEEANKNKVILADSVKKDVRKLKQTQVNFSHKRAWNVCGTILDSWINEETNEIEIVFSFYKSVYPKQWEEALELLSKGELTVSFELSVEKQDIEMLSGGVKKLHKVDFDGVGLLMGEKPAYPMAYVLEMAKQETIDKEFESIVEYNSPEFIYAKKIDDEIKEKLNSSNLKEDCIVMDKDTQEKLLATHKSNILAEFGEAVKDWTDEDYLNDEKIIALRESLKPKENLEQNTENATLEVTDVENKTENIEVASKEKTIENRMYEVEWKEDGSAEVIETISIQNEIDGKLVKDEKVIRHTVYLSSKIDTMTAEYEAKLTSKDEEISFIKANAKKIIELRSELGDFAKDLSDEELMNSDKIEIARLKKDIATLKASKSETVIATEKDVALQATITTTETAAVVDEDDRTARGKRIKKLLKMKNQK